MRIKKGTLVLLVVMTVVFVIAYLEYGKQNTPRRQNNMHDVIKASNWKWVDKADQSRVEAPYKTGSVSDSRINVNDDRMSGANRKSVIIVAYHRTGSSLTGSLFQAYPGSFYVFEPFKYLYDHMDTVLTYLNGSSVRWTSDNQNRIEQELLDAWLSCDLSRIHVETLLERHHIDATDDLRQLTMCVKHQIPNADTGSAIEYFIKHNNPKLMTTIRKCTKPIIDQCRKSKLLTMKFIRLSMEHVQSFLPKYPELKAVHLVRDPRGSVLSRKKVYNMPYKFLAREYCGSLTKNTIITDCLSKTFPDRLLSVKYEALAMYPVDTTEALYTFIGLPFDSDIRSSVLNLVSSDRASEDCSYCVRKRNSSLHAFKWRTEITKDIFDIVDENCHDTYSLQGYIHLDTISDVRNMSKPSMSRG